jgi:hypothetical protein
MAILAATGCDRAKTQDYALVQSLTDGKSTAKKYYMGWGEVLQGFMGNETYYDVKHTNDIFSQKVGGNYESTRLDRDGGEFDAQAVAQAWRQIGEKIKGDDMYVQYSSGHGYERGLGIGVSYDDIRDNALKYKAHETVIFTMACHSGGLIDSFKQRQDEMERWKAEGRVVYVMSSSTTDQLSSTGPGNDPSEQGPQGSAGSAFGHALWKALAGEADGAVDGVKDGFIDLSEIEAFTKSLTHTIGGHDPVAYGFNYQYLIMNEVPGSSYLAQVKGGTDGLSDAQLRASIAELDKALAD